MAKANGQNSSKSMPIQATVCEIITESYDYFMNDTDRIMLELVCEKLMEDLDAIFKRMRLGAIDQQPGEILGLRAGKRLKPF